MVIPLPFAPITRIEGLKVPVISPVEDWTLVLEVNGVVMNSMLALRDTVEYTSTVREKDSPKVRLSGRFTPPVDVCENKLGIIMSTTGCWMNESLVVEFL